MKTEDLKAQVSRLLERTVKVAMCGYGSGEIVINGQVLRPDQFTAYVEFRLAHAFPVVTADKTAFHPQVVANSFRSMRHKVFDLAHIMRAYDPKNNPRDRMLGTVLEVELTGEPRGEDGRWRIEDGVEPVGIRAVACMHKQAEQVSEILRMHQAGQLQWTVSMEDEFYVENCGFLIKAEGERLKAKGEEGEEWEERTPDDLRVLGYTYVAAAEAPLELLKCFDPDRLGGWDPDRPAVKNWRGIETIVLLGGLDGAVSFKGVGLTPEGKEEAAEVTQMLASKASSAELPVDKPKTPELVELLGRAAVLG